MVDFLDFHLGEWHWFAFNLADSAICLGSRGAPHRRLAWASRNPPNCEVGSGTGIPCLTVGFIINDFRIVGRRTRCGDPGARGVRCSFYRAIGKTRVIPDEFHGRLEYPAGDSAGLHAAPAAYRRRQRPAQNNHRPTRRARPCSAPATISRRACRRQPARLAGAGRSRICCARPVPTARHPISVRQVDADPKTGIPFERTLVDKIVNWDPADHAALGRRPPIPVQRGEPAAPVAAQTWRRPAVRATSSPSAAASGVGTPTFERTTKSSVPVVQLAVLGQARLPAGPAFVAAAKTRAVTRLAITSLGRAHHDEIAASRISHRVTGAVWFASSSPSRLLPAHAELFEAHQFVLKNGLEVVVIPNHRAPIVTQMVWYKVGAQPTRTTGKLGRGAHFLEHLMFRGTKTVAPGAVLAPDRAERRPRQRLHQSRLDRRLFPGRGRRPARNGDAARSRPHGEPRHQRQGRVALSCDVIIEKERRMRIDNNPGLAVRRTAPDRAFSAIIPIAFR